MSIIFVCQNSTIIFFIFFNNIFYFIHNNNIRLILVELRVIWDLFFEFYIIRAKIYNGLITLDYYKSATRVYCLYVSYIVFFYIFNIWL